MKLIKLFSIIFLALGIVPGMVRAQSYFTGSFGAGVLGSSASYSASTLTLGHTNFFSTVSAAGTFSGFEYDGLLANTGQLTGLSSAPRSENIPDYFIFAQASPLSPSLGNGGNGDIYSFTLTSITETSSGDFTGTGTLIDASHALNNTAATFALGFSGASNYSFSLACVTPAPEPSSLALVAGGSILIPALCRRSFRKNQKPRPDQ